jgi:cell division protein FtsQ
MARKNASTIAQEELYLPPEQPAAPELDDARTLDLEAEKESPFLRGQKRVSVRRGSLPKKTATRIIWMTLTATALFVCAMGAATLYHYGEHSWRFRIDSSDNIEVTGLQNVTRGQVMEVMGGDIGRNIFFIPLSERQTQLEQIPWVESASVMRFVPNRLRIDIHERTPVAFARVGSKILLVDAKGVLMDLPSAAKKKYSFPVIMGMNSGEPLSTRRARMKIYNDLVGQLDSDGAHYSHELNEVDLSDPDDVKVLAGSPQGEVLVHLGSSNYLERYKIYVTHVQEWRQQFDKLQSVDLRYDHQIIVNPDPRGTSRQAPLSASTARAAAAAGVKPAALLTREIVPSISTGKVVKPASKPAVRKTAKPVHKRKPVSKWSATHHKATVKAAASKNQTVKPGSTSSRKPSPAIAKSQDHP